MTSSISTYTQSALEILKETSRTFYIPIIKLTNQVAQDAVASAYLCLRAIDEIEDHNTLSNDVKIQILNSISCELQKYSSESNAESMTPAIFQQYQKNIPEVSMRIGEWVMYAPQEFRARIADTTSTMADRMAYWAQKNWEIKDKGDLDHYTFSVAGNVGLILSEIWEWIEGIKTNRDWAVSFGRGLQAVNILRNHKEDKVERNVDFYPKGWTDDDMIHYSRKQLIQAQLYKESLPKTSQAFIFCRIPLALATATLTLISIGKQKLTREEVMFITEHDENAIKFEQSLAKQANENIGQSCNNSSTNDSAEESLDCTDLKEALVQNE